MNYQIVISGLGGQGVLFITKLLAETCMETGDHVLTSETHGMAQRGGIVVSHLKIGDFNSPLIRPGSADLVIALRSETFEHHYGFLKEGGKALVNTSATSDLIEKYNAVIIDADKLAEQDDNRGSVNLYVIGAALALVPVCSPEKLKDHIMMRLSKKGDEIISQAVVAVDRGFKSIS